MKDILKKKKKKNYPLFARNLTRMWQRQNRFGDNTRGPTRHANSSRSDQLDLVEHATYKHKFGKYLIPEGGDGIELGNLWLIVLIDQQLVISFDQLHENHSTRYLDWFSCQNKFYISMLIMGILRFLLKSLSIKAGMDGFGKLLQVN